MIALGTLDLIFKRLTIIGLVGISVEVFRRRDDGGDLALYALGFKAPYGCPDDSVVLRFFGSLVITVALCLVGFGR